MVMNKSELLAALQAESRIVLHLAGKADRAKLDYRPTPKQRSTLELLRYLSMMGPTLLWYMKSRDTGGEAWAKAEAEANARDVDQAVEAIAAQGDAYATLLADVSDADLRMVLPGPDGQPTTMGAAMVTGLLCGCTAYRMQLFLYLKASGRPELNTMNLWAGMDTPAGA